MTDRKLNEALRSMLTGELVGELKRRGEFCVVGTTADLISTRLPKSLKMGDKIVAVVVRAS